MTMFYQEVDRQVQERIQEIVQSEKKTGGGGNNQAEEETGEDSSEELEENELRKEAEEDGRDKKAALQTEYETRSNVVTRILEPGKTAYISISFFDYEQMEADQEILFPFYEEIWDYDNLIIDITNNPGGSMSYFNDLVAAPLTKETLIVPSYQFFKDGQNNRRFLRIEEGVRSGLY